MSDNELDTNMFGTQLVGTETDPQSLEKQLTLYQQHLAELPDSASEVDRARVLLDIAETQHWAYFYSMNNGRKQLNPAMCCFKPNNPRLWRPWARGYGWP